MEIEKVLKEQRNFFETGATKSIQFRQNALKRLEIVIKKHEREIADALKKDLHKSAFESYMTEIGLLLNEIRYVKKHLAGWMKEKWVPTPFAQFPAKSMVIAEPYGVVLIIAPWNYPFLLCLQPLIDAISGGNCCVIKPSGASTVSFKMIKKIIEEAFPLEFVAVIKDGEEENKKLLEQKFDFIFYTGGPRVGKLIMEQAAKQLTAAFSFNIPQRWSIAHLYQAILNGEEHLPRIDYLSTLAGYVHWKLTGKRVLGVGEASGMFPIDSKTKDYDQNMVETFDKLIAPKGYSWKLRDILPQVLVAGEPAGNLTQEGAKLLDPSGELEAGIPMCPPEGDAGTGMVATNSVTVHTGNVSAGTSVFAMVVMDENETLKKVHEEIDMVTTPDGLPVAMAHCNNCTSDLNAWVGIFKEFQQALGVPVDMNQLFSVLYNKALEGDVDCGGLMAYNYFSGESITGFEEGRPLFVRTPDSKFTLANFMRTHLYTSLGALKVGLDILFKEEGVKLDNIYGHGGLFKTKGVGQRIMAAAINAPVSLMETAGEGGAWGIALLAAYMKNKEEGQTLDDYLEKKVFAGFEGVEEKPDPADVKGFDEFICRYKEGLPIEKAAVEFLK